MRSVSSFDIFDTLLARTTKNPTDIFNIVEKEYPYPDFKRIRLDAQSRSLQKIRDIYHHFKQITDISDESIESLMNFELKIEMQNTLPILTNILKIKNDDIFVSDMYLEKDQIRSLLNYHNINSNPELFVSSSGKSDGSMWKTLPDKSRIISHTGDNQHSDIVMASKYHIPGIYTKVHRFTKLEDKLVNEDAKLCTFFRKFRLMNPYSEETLEYKIYDQQIQYNIPILLFMCKKLETILITENRTTVLFLSRDGCLIYKIFSALYPNFKSIYLYSSRIMNYNYNDHYISYLKQHYQKDTCILFDLHGSFSSGRSLFMNVFGHLPRIFIFDINILSNHHKGITYITNFSNRIETFNQDIRGSLVDYTDTGPINMPTEQPVKLIRIMHDTVISFISYVSSQKHILDNPIFNNNNFWIGYYRNDIVPSELICNNVKEHNMFTLTYLANKYNSDKGDTYKCAHFYTKKYQEIFSAIIDENTIDLLEIGLNRDKNLSIPSLMIWNDYFSKNVNITGFDIIPDFLKFNGLHNNIKICIGDQSNKTDLYQLKDKKYNVIIDDGYHASKHQQISFLTLWENVKPGGFYIIEDLHYQPEAETCLKTKFLFENWKQNNWISTEFITETEVNNIKPTIESIGFYDSRSKLWGNSVKNALVYVKKIY